MRNETPNRPKIQGGKIYKAARKRRGGSSAKVVSDKMQPSTYAKIVN